MSNAIREYVESLPDSEKVLLINGFEKFEKYGFIGDEPLRLHAQAISKMLGRQAGDDIWHVNWMNYLAAEAHRYFAKKYIDEHKFSFNPDAGAI